MDQVVARAWRWGRRWSRRGVMATVVLGTLGAGGTELTAQDATPAPAAALIERALESRAKGDARASVVVFEVADFQCPYCARFSRTVFPAIDSVYIRTGKVQWVFVNLPLPSHHRAWGAAKAALCAGAVGDAFWSVHQRLFSGQPEWSTARDAAMVFTRYAHEAGVPLEPFRDCLLNDRVAPLILEDILFAAQQRVGGTPTFLISPDHKLVGLKSFEEWQVLIEDALRRLRENGRIR
jgi:protein-disulfide isomerase